MEPQATGGAERGRRIASLDGLRGVAAVVVVVHHYMALLHWQMTPQFSDSLPGLPGTTLALADTPLGILFNGPFAVSVFFVLSGFVMAAAAERRRRELPANVLMRYLRLALPVTVSVMLAWLWLSVFPDAAARMQETLEEPSPWLQYSYKVSIPGPHLALADGLVGNFMRGMSLFNNVLWAMQVELIGSLALFVVYWLLPGRGRVALILAAGMVAVLTTGQGYLLGFTTGGLLYEAARRQMLGRLSGWPGLLALGLGVTLGAPGAGLDARLGLPDLPGLLTPGNPASLWPVFAATMILFAVLTLRPAVRLLETRLPQWLGRISFGLYLVHVPPLYTAVATAHLTGALPGPLLALVYGMGVLLLAHLFTLTVDEPTLRGLRGLRQRLAEQAFLRRWRS